MIDQTTLAREARRILRRLSEPGALLAVAPDMEKAVVVRDTADGRRDPHRRGRQRRSAQAMALKDWIACAGRGASRATGSRRRGGRRCATHGGTGKPLAALPRASRLCGAVTGRAAEAEMERQALDPRGARTRYAVCESPLAALARRRDRDGSPFLSDDLVSAGERLREDFELARSGRAWPRTGTVS